MTTNITTPALTLKEAAAYLSISYNTMHKLADEKKVIGFQVGRVWRFDQSDLEAYKAQQKIVAGHSVEVQPKIKTKGNRKWGYTSAANGGTTRSSSKVSDFEALLGRKINVSLKNS